MCTPPLRFARGPGEKRLLCNSFVEQSSPRCCMSRSRRTRDPISRGKNEADPRVGRWLPLLCFFLFTNCTATSVLFINCFFHFCCYVCLLLLVPVLCTYAYGGVPMYIRVSRVKCPCPIVSIEWSCGGWRNSCGVLLVCGQTSPIPYHRRIIIKYH